MRLQRWQLIALVAVGLAACGTEAQLQVSDGIGPDPKLPPPNKELIPTLKIAPAVGWPAGGRPNAAEGTVVVPFADGLDHPRWVYVLPNGDVLVAETNAPPRPEQGKGIKAWFKKQAMKKAGAATPSANRITLLRDTDGDGVADIRSAFLSELNSPFGMTLVGNDFYVANTDALVRFPYTQGQTQIDARGSKVTDLPGGPLNHHWTKNVIASADGGKPSGAPVDVLTGFVDAEGNAHGRPVGVAMDKGGALLVADDVGNVIWRVSSSTNAKAAAR